LGAIGAHEWRRRGVPVPALGAKIHPFYGVFAPVRGEYVSLLARVSIERRARFPEEFSAFDIGTGTGVLAVLLARQGARVVGTDIDPRAVACARENATRLGVGERVQIVQADLFPQGRARLAVANPPWIPTEPHGPLDRAVYDPGGVLLARIVQGFPEHLEEQGEAWLVLSNLGEILGLRPTGTVPALAEAAGLRIHSTYEEAPTHPRARSGNDPLALARRAETTRLYVLRPR
ncbi:MAG TPA: class I SAM-dependent methyltransferase, partial [Anaeromyxobacteraceae bacterium]|nr:class I SAM-dependent methyltransferase [Anaeromyxobacteraceae bacterium]